MQQTFHIVSIYREWLARDLLICNKNVTHNTLQDKHGEPNAPDFKEN